jgi:hypothetical protein
VGAGGAGGGTMDFFQEPFYNKQPSYYLSLDMVILITSFFQENDEKKNFKTMNVLCFLFLFYLKTHQLTKIHPKKH